MLQSLMSNKDCAHCAKKVSITINLYSYKYDSNPSQGPDASASETLISCGREPNRRILPT